MGGGGVCTRTLFRFFLLPPRALGVTILDELFGRSLVNSTGTSCNDDDDFVSDIVFTRLCRVRQWNHLESPRDARDQDGEIRSVRKDSFSSRSPSEQRLSTPVRACRVQQPQTLESISNHYRAGLLFWRGSRCKGLRSESFESRMARSIYK